ncbi:MAG: transposase, partial [Desulfomonilaceae bacterium]|nr:transposase [Desulfomonilaceae bacterium]
TSDHLHILTSLHPTVSLANLVKDIKGGLSYWIKSNNLCSGFSNWQAGYGAFTHSECERDRLIEYIRKQEEHHRRVSFLDELRDLLIEAGVEFDERRLFPERP